MPQTLATCMIMLLTTYQTRTILRLVCDHGLQRALKFLHGAQHVLVFLECAVQLLHLRGEHLESFLLCCAVHQRFLQGLVPALKQRLETLLGCFCCIPLLAQIVLEMLQFVL